MHIDKNLRVIIIYRSPSSSVRPFLDEFANYLSDVIMTRDELLIAGNFNLHFEEPSAPGVSYLKDILAENNLEQRVTQPTHRGGHMLDLLITRTTSSIIRTTEVYRSCISDHFSVLFPLAISTVQSQRVD